jgi:SAM-dependent methyltransferase
MSTLENWDRQIRLFAHYFQCYSNLPSQTFTLLDVGCGTGAALGELKRFYPHADLFGCDFENDHIEIARRMNGENAHFFRADIRDVSGRYDIIYASNIIEHLKDWQPVLNRLITFCDRLYVLVPYREELSDHKSGVPNVDHVVSFNKSSFDFLKSKEISVEMKVIRTPHAWGHPLKREIYLRTRALLKNEPFDVQRELLVAITNTNRGNEVLPIEPFKSRLSFVGRFMSTINRQEARL